MGPHGESSGLAMLPSLEADYSAIADNRSSRPSSLFSSYRPPPVSSQQVKSWILIPITMAAIEKRPEIIELSRDLRGVPQCEEYECMISGMM